MGKGNGFYYINPSCEMNGCTCKVGRGKGKVVGQAFACARQLCIAECFSPCQVVNMTFLSLWDCRLECAGNGIVNSGRLINLLHLRFSPASFSVYCDPCEQRGERPGRRQPRECRRLIPNELLTEFFEKMEKL